MTSKFASYSALSSATKQASQEIRAARTSLATSKERSMDDDPAETAYWNFDARVKGYGPWKGRPQSERDAFKAEWRAAYAQGQDTVKDDDAAS